jgi:hypothetical protein
VRVARRVLVGPQARSATGTVAALADLSQVPNQTVVGIDDRQAGEKLANDYIRAVGRECARAVQNSSPTVRN